MIVTLTPNPSVDRTIEVDAARARRGAARPQPRASTPGGKGVNVSRALAAHGIKTRAVLPSGGAEGAQLAALLEPQGIEIVPVPISGAVRANVSVVEPDGTVTKLNEPGPELGADEVQLLIAATRGAAEAGAEWVVCCGSLPRGVPVDFYATLLPVLHDAGCRVVVDSSGPALTAALAAPARPDQAEPGGARRGRRAAHRHRRRRRRRGALTGATGRGHGARQPRRGRSAADRRRRGLPRRSPRRDAAQRRRRRRRHARRLPGRRRARPRPPWSRPSPGARRRRPCPAAGCRRRKT